MRQRQRHTERTHSMSVEGGRGEARRHYNVMLSMKNSIPRFACILQPLLPPLPPSPPLPAPPPPPPTSSPQPDPISQSSLNHTQPPHPTPSAVPLSRRPKAIFFLLKPSPLKTDQRGNLTKGYKHEPSFNLHSCVAPPDQCMRRHLV